MSAAGTTSTGGLDQRSIALVLGISHARVQQIEQAALVKLAKILKRRRVRAADYLAERVPILVQMTAPVGSRHTRARSPGAWPTSHLKTPPRAPPPDWMTRPELLPKKPPTRNTQDQPGDHTR
jgi:hypothetical protein